MKRIKQGQIICIPTALTITLNLSFRQVITITILYQLLYV